MSRYVLVRSVLFNHPLVFDFHKYFSKLKKNVYAKCKHKGDVFFPDYMYIHMCYVWTYIYYPDVKIRYYVLCHLTTMQVLHVIML